VLFPVFLLRQAFQKSDLFVFETRYNHLRVPPKIRSAFSAAPLTGEPAHVHLYACRPSAGISLKKGCFEFRRFGTAAPFFLIIVRL
jgi:hypothetical protein